jgi:hypothetical protein
MKLTASWASVTSNESSGKGSSSAGRQPHVHTGQTLRAGLDERCRGIHRGEAVGAEHLAQFRRQCPWAAADVERSLAGGHVRDLVQRPSKGRPVAADVSVVGLRGGAKARGSGCLRYGLQSP